jgi:glycosyltransferase involved in cell wall biosynthesis
VLRVYHGGRDSAHRARERALQRAGVDVTLAVPSAWKGVDRDEISDPGLDVRELAIVREGDVNRHAYEDDVSGALVRDVQPDVIDIHEEPFSVATRQWLKAAGTNLPVVMYTAQNVDKRYPPPFAQYERAAYRRVSAFYPCSAQAASVVRGKGFAGLIEVLPLGYDDSLVFTGNQSLDDDEIRLGLFGRLVPEKGVLDAVRVLAALQSVRPTTLVIAGDGPATLPALELAGSLSVRERVEVAPWRSTEELAAIYRTTHVVLVPSQPTETWVEQFGRVIVEAQASGAVVAGYASGSIPEVAGEAAILAEVGDVTGLAEGIRRLLLDADDFSRRRKRGIALSAGRTWTKVAERQADLYRRVVAGNVPRLDVPRSPRLRRELARAEFETTAATTAGRRPFALPVLRRGGVVPDALGLLLDVGAEIAAGTPRLRVTRNS